MLPYDSCLKSNSRVLRSKMADAEQKLWQRLRRKQINGWQFYRQKPLGTYIVDFYCAAAHLVIEIDGSQHYEPEHQQADRLRDEYLTGLGLRVLRFDNRQVLLEMEAVVEIISKIPPNPPFSKGGISPPPINPPPSPANRETSPTPTNPAPFFHKTVDALPPTNPASLFQRRVDPPPSTTPVPPFEKGGLGGINNNALADDEAQP